MMNDAERAERAGGSADIQSLAQAQYEAAGTIYGSNDPTEILDALVGFTGMAYENAQLGLVDPEATPTALNILATYSDRRVALAKYSLRLDTLPASDTYSAIEVLNVANLDFDPFLDAAEKQQLQSENTRALLVIPMVVSQRLIGVIVFRNSTPINIDSSRLRALRNLVDQAAVVFENQTLLRNTESSLQEVSTLYEINRDMLRAVDAIDILRVMRQKLAPEATTIFHIAAVNDGSASKSYLLRHITARDGERDVQTLVTLSVGAALNDNNTATDVTFVEAITVEPQHPLHDMITARNAASYVVINIRERGQIQDFVAITFDFQQEFEERTRRLYAAVADQTTIVLQNQRLLIDAQSSALKATQQLRTLQILNRMSIELSNIADENALLDYSIQVITETLGVDHGGMVLIEPSEDQGIVRAEFPATGTLGQIVPFENNTVVELLQRRPFRALVIEDVATDERLPQITREFLVNQAGIRAMLILPLLSQDRLIGSVGLDVYQAGHTFEYDLIQTANTMAAQVGIALQNVRLIKDSMRRAEQLARVAAFGQSMQATLSETTIFERLFAEADQMLPIDTFDIAFYDAERDLLRIVSQRRSITDTQSFSVTLPLTSLPGMVYASGQTVNIADVQNRTNLPALPGIPLNTRSVLITALVARGQPFGVVMLTSAQSNAYSTTDSAIFEQITNQLGVAIENSRTFQQAQKTARNQTLINAVSARLQQVASLEDMVEVTLREIGRALGARRARARFTPQSTPTSVKEEG